MRTVPYSDILRGTAALAGLSYDSLGAEDFALLRAFHDRRLQIAWELHGWPDLLRIEQRWFYPDYSAGENYNAGARVFDPCSQKYFQAITETSGNQPTIGGVVNAEFWEALDTFDRCIAFEQEGRLPIGELLLATNADPRITTRRGLLTFWISDRGFQFYTPETSVWLQYRIRRPELSGAPFDASAVYTSGQQAYFQMNGAGDFYTANNTTDAGESPAAVPDKWDRVELPYIFRGYLIEAAFADWLVADGQEDKAARHEGLALGYLELEVDKLHRQQGQTRRLNYRS